MKLTVPLEKYKKKKETGENIEINSNTILLAVDNFLFMDEQSEFLCTAYIFLFSLLMLVLLLPEVSLLCRFTAFSCLILFAVIPGVKTVESVPSHRSCRTTFPLVVQLLICSYTESQAGSTGTTVRHPQILQRIYGTESMRTK
jgi:hypothetical protein